MRGGVAAAGHVAPSRVASRIHINPDLGLASMILCRIAFAVKLEMLVFPMVLQGFQKNRVLDPGAARGIVAAP